MSAALCGAFQEFVPTVARPVGNPRQQAPHGFAGVADDADGDWMIDSNLCAFDVDLHELLRYGHCPPASHDFSKPAADREHRVGVRQDGPAPGAMARVPLKSNRADRSDLFHSML